MVTNQQRQAPRAHLQQQAATQVAHALVEVTGVIGDPLLLLEGGDLRVIDHIDDVDPIAVQRYLAESIDGEVAQRVGEGRHGDRDGQGERTQQCNQSSTQPHDIAPRAISAFRATGANKREKYGLMYSAWCRSPMAAALWPRRASIIPRWKNIVASCVPSLSACRDAASASRSSPVWNNVQARMSAVRTLGRSAIAARAARRAADRSRR